MGSDLGVQSFVRAIVCLTLLSVWPVAAWSQVDAESEPAAVQRNSNSQFVLPLQQLFGDAQPRQLSGVDSSLQISLPLPASWTAEQVTLELAGTASRALIDSSQLLVLVNDRVVEQLPLNGQRPNFRHRIRIPTGLLEPGFNRVQLRAVQHYTEICEYPMAPQLWTQIDVSESRFVIQARARDARSRLSELSALFDRASWQSVAELAVFSDASQDEQLLPALGYIAQGIGHRYDFIPTRLHHQPLPQRLADVAGQMPGGSRVAVVLGTYQQLSSLLGNEMALPQRQGPMLALKPLPGQQENYLLMLLGEDAAQITEAAAAFAIPGVPWPDSQWTAIDSIAIPAEANLEKRFDIPTAAQGAFPLRALGYQTQTLQGINADSGRIHIWNNTWQGRMQVRLHLAYASGMAGHSALNVLTNGVLNGSIPLDNPQGGLYENYAVTIPAGIMQPGWNTLEFRPVLIPQSHGGECQPFFPGNLAVTIYEDSTIQKFGGDELQQMDLASLSGRGYVFTEQPLGNGIAFRLTDSDNATLSAGMTLVAKLSQVYKRPLLNSRFGLADASDADSTLDYWVGSFDRLPDTLQHSLQVQLPGSVSVNVPLIQSATVQVIEGVEWLNQSLDALGLRKTPPQQFTEVALNLSGEFADNVFALSDKQRNKTRIVFTAEDAELLQRGLHSVIDYGQWAQLRGMLSYWQPESERVFAVTADDAPFSAFGLRGGLGLWVSQYPWRALFLLLGFIGLMMWLSRRVLVQYKRRNQQPH